MKYIPTTTSPLFHLGDLIEVTLEGSSMFGKTGNITGPLARVPTGGWEGYQTDIKHPGKVGDGFGWFRPSNLKLIRIKLMNDRRITFERSSGGDWVTEVDGETRSLCNSGIRSYVGLPPEVMEFDAVFTVNCSDQPGYKLGPRTGFSHPTLDLDEDPDFYSDIKNLMADLHQEGYRYMHVEYDENE